MWILRSPVVIERKTRTQIPLSSPSPISPFLPRLLRPFYILQRSSSFIFHFSPPLPFLPECWIHMMSGTSCMHRQAPHRMCGGKGLILHFLSSCAPFPWGYCLSTFSILRSSSSSSSELRQRIAAFTVGRARPRNRLPPHRRCGLLGR